VTVGSDALLLGGSGVVAVGFAVPRPKTVAKTGTKAADLILAREDRSPSSLPRQKLTFRGCRRETAMQNGVVLEEESAV
jgi:hypothetical protein